MIFRVLLVGLGAIGLGYDLRLDPKRYVQSHARAFALHPAFELAGGVDPDPDRRALFAGEYRAPAHATVAAALADVAPDVVVIATPTADHAPILAQVLAGCRPRLVLCEKPLADSPAQARAMLAACEAAGVVLVVNYFRRALPAVREVRERLRAGGMGAEAKAVGWYTKGLQHNGSHLVDLLGFWLGGLESAHALGPARAGPLGPDLDCQLRFARGEALLLAGWHDSFAYFALELLTPAGRVRLDPAGAMSWQGVVPDPAWPGYHSLATPGQPMEAGLGRYQAHVVEELARQLDSGRAGVLCSGVEALRTLETIEALVQQAQGRKA